MTAVALDPPPAGGNPAVVEQPTVAATAVSKWFGQKVAVSDVTVSFGPGVTGLLGPNGAGKTTLLRMLAGLLTPSEGKVDVLGVDPRSTYAVYREVGLVPEEDAVYRFMTGIDFVTYAARLSGLANPAAEAERAIHDVEMTDAADRAIDGYSKGMRQRIKVAAALVHSPSVLYLDEPLNGTDPVQRAKLISLFRRLGAAGTTVIVSSHVLQEVERMADRVIAMVDGKLAAAGDIHAIRRAMVDIPYHVVIEASDPRRLGSALLTSDAVRAVEVADGKLVVETTELSTLGRLVPATARDLGIHLTRFAPQDESLESVFRYLVNRK